MQVKDQKLTDLKGLLRFYVFLPAEKNIIWLDITMNDSVVVQQK